MFHAGVMGMFESMSRSDELIAIHKLAGLEDIVAIL
jgi:hypothetical protein